MLSLCKQRWYCRDSSDDNSRMKMTDIDKYVCGDYADGEEDGQWQVGLCCDYADGDDDWK